MIPSSVKKSLGLAVVVIIGVLSSPTSSSWNSAVVLAFTTTSSSSSGRGRNSNKLQKNGQQHGRSGLLSVSPPPQTTTTTTRTMMIPPIAPDHLASAANALSDPFLLLGGHHGVVADPHSWWQSTSQVLADAAAAAPAKVGWWRQYLNIFKNALSTVHSTVDGPLRSVGIEQTWGVSIFLFTASVRACLIPLSIQQSKSSEYMKALKPYVSQVKKKYKDDQEMQNKAVGKLYQDAQQNPLAGCAVSLAQLPIFLGLYRGVRLLAMDGQLNEPFLWIPSLAGPVEPPNYRDLNWLTQGWTAGVDGGLPTPPMGWEHTLPFLIMPMVLVLLQSTTMRILQPPVDDDMTDEEREQVEKTQGIFKFLPLMIGFFSLQVPAGLTIYWFTSNIFTLSQSLAVRAYFAANPPEIELPDYWDAAIEKDFDSMTPQERRQAMKAGIKIGPSLEDLVDEARFHVYVNRNAPSSSLPSTALASTSTELPPDLQAWVNAGVSSVEQEESAAVSPATAA